MTATTSTIKTRLSALSNVAKGRIFQLRPAQKLELPVQYTVARYCDLNQAPRLINKQTENNREQTQTPGHHEPLELSRSRQRAALIVGEVYSPLDKQAAYSCISFVTSATLPLLFTSRFPLGLQTPPHASSNFHINHSVLVPPQASSTGRKNTANPLTGTEERYYITTDAYYAVQAWLRATASGTQDCNGPTKRTTRRTN